MFLLLVSEEGALRGEHLPAVRAGQPVQVPVHAATHNVKMADPDTTGSAETGSSYEIWTQGGKKDGWLSGGMGG